jgi:hypothetical protein
MRGTPQESRPGVRWEAGKPDGSGACEHQDRTGSRATQHARYCAYWQDSEGDDDFMTVSTRAATHAATSKILAPLKGRLGTS